MPNLCIRWLAALALVAAPSILQGQPDGASPDLDKLREATGGRTGLAVHVGTSDGKLESALAQGGRMLVHGLALDTKAVAAARQTIATANVDGLATVQQVNDVSRLPYADGLVNVLIVDLDALGDGAPAETDRMRVLAPRGVAFVRSDGTWKTSVKPSRSDVDEWPQYWYNATGNPISRDKAVAPPTGVQWIGGIHSEGTTPQNGYRIADGLLVYESTLDKDRSVMVCRDAYNGIVQWAVVREHRDAYRAFKGKPLLNIDGRIFTVIEEENAPLVEIDAKTGDVIRRFEEGGRTAKSQGRGRFDPGTVTNVVHHDGKLIQTAGNTVYVLKLDGSLVWKKTLEGQEALDFPTVDPEGGRVFVASAPMERWKRGARNPQVEADAIFALDLKAGRELWKSPLKEKLVTQIIYDKGGVYLYEAMPIGHDEFSMKRLDAATGECLWTYEGSKQEIGQKLEMIVRDGRIYLMSHGVAVFSAADGKLLEQWRYGVNARCDASRATESMLLLAYGNLAQYGIDSPRMTHQRIARSSCATGAFPAYGMMYFLPTACGCESWLRGHLALHSRTAPPPIDDARRLEKGTAFDKPIDAKPESDAWPTYRHDDRRTAATKAAIPAEPKILWQKHVTTRPQGPVATDWSLTNDPSRFVLTAPTVAQGCVFVAVPHANRVVALDAKSGQERWSLTLEGRPDAPPTIHAGVCYISTRHGYVYALRADTGEMIWRFNAARSSELILAYGQLESASPLFGSPIVRDGAVFVVSGRHPEAGGLTICKLDGLTGRPLAKRELSDAHDWHPADEKNVQTPMNDTVNLALVADSDGKLHIPGVAIDPETLDIVTSDDVKGDVVWYIVKVGTGATVSPAADPAAPIYFGTSYLMHNASIVGPGSRHGTLAQRLAIDGDQVFVYGMQGQKEWDKYADIGQASYRDGVTGAKAWAQKFPLNATGLIKAGDRLVLTGTTIARRDEASRSIIALIPAGGGDIHTLELPAPPIADGAAAAYGRVYLSMEDGSLICLGR